MELHAQRPELSLLVDWSRVDAGPHTAGLVRVRARTPLAADVRRASVAPTDILFGLARMYELSAARTAGEEYPVFRTRDEALRWLQRR